MAYVDTRNTTRKLGAGAAVLAIEAAIGVALVTGLTATMTRKADEPIITHDITPPSPSPEPVAEVRPPDRKDTRAIDRPETIIKLPSETGYQLPELTDGDRSTGTESLGDFRFPEPDVTADPPPLFKPRAAIPKGRMAQWVTTNDYPTSDLRLEHHGRTAYRLTIDASGAVTECTVTASSGHPGLDKATCDNVKRRARFEPATDQTGARVAGSYNGSVTWQIPTD